MVAKQYPDAREAIAGFEEKKIDLDEVTVFRPGDKVELELRFRNVKEAEFQVYRVDLMKLYLREKNLENVTKVHLAGIAPELERVLPLGDGLDYRDRKLTTELPLTEEAAYLVICRGDDLFTSGLLLISPLEIEVREEKGSGRIRANVKNRVDGGYAAEVHVKAIGSRNRRFRSGETDLRGIFVADGLTGEATVIARAGDSRYAFYRGDAWLGAPEQGGRRVEQQQARPGMQSLDFRSNLNRLNGIIQQEQGKYYDQLRRQTNRGVKVQQAK